MKSTYLLILALGAFSNSFADSPNKIITEFLNNTTWYSELTSDKEYVYETSFQENTCTKTLTLYSGESVSTKYTYEVLNETDANGNPILIIEYTFADGVHEGKSGKFQLIECNNDTLIMKNLRNDVDLRYFRKK